MPSYKIGVNFDTENSVVSYLEDGKLQVFEDVEGNEDLRTQRLSQESSYLAWDKEKLTPVCVPVEYQCEVLLSKTANCFSFTPKKGTIESLVLSIPEAWYTEIDSSARVRLQHSLACKLGIEDTLFQFVREPVAAAAYWIWAMQHQRPRLHGNLLICDLGRLTINISLCHISMENKVNILYSDWQKEAGFAFALRCVEFAYAQKHGYPLTADNPEVVRLLKAFEVEKINSRERSISRLIAYLKASEAMAEYDLYCFGGGYAVKCRHISEAFAPIEQGIQEVAQRFRTWMQVNQQQFDYLFLIGDFSRFLFAQNAILQALDVKDNNPLFDRSFNNNHGAFAISNGACLIANNLVDPIEKSRQTLGIVAETLSACAEREQRFIPIIQSGTNFDNLTVAQFPDMPFITAFQGNIMVIKLWIDSKPQGQVFREIRLDNIQLPNYSCENSWRVGMRVICSRTRRLYLVIEDAKEQQRVECDLGMSLGIITIP